MISIAKNAAYLLATRWVTKVARFVYTIVLARRLGPELYGLLSYGMAWYLAFFSFTNFGIDVILSRDIGYDRRKGTERVAQTLALRLLLTLIMMPLCAGIGWISEESPGTRWLLVIFSVALAGRGTVGWTQSVFVAYEVSHYSFRQNAIFRTLEVVLGSLVVFSGGKVLAVAIVHALVWWLQAFRGFLIIRRHLASFDVQQMWHGLNTLLAQGLVLGIAGIAISWFRQGPLIGLRYLGEHEEMLGQLAVVMQAFWVLSHLPAAANRAALPALSRAVSQQSGQNRFFTETMLRVALVLGTVTGLAGLSFGPWMVQGVFGTDYTVAGRLLGFALWLLIPWTIGHTLYTVALSEGRTGLAVIGTASGLLALFVSMLVWIPRFDIAGAVLATAVGMGTWAVTLLAIMAKTEKLGIGRTLLRPGVAVLLALVAFSALRPLSVWLPLPGALLTFFAVLLLLSGISEKEKNLVMRLLPGKGISEP